MNLEVLFAEAEESGSGLDLLLPATSELVAGVAAFSIVFFFIWKWALPALNKTLEERSSLIEGKIKSAEETKVEAESTKAEYVKLVSNANSEVQKIIDAGKLAAEKVKEEIIEQAKKDAEAIVEKAKSDSDSERERLSSELKNEVASLSLAISQKVASSMSEKDQQELIDKFIKEMETTN